MAEASIGQKILEWLYVVHYSTIEILARAGGCSESVAKTTLYRLVKRGLVKNFKRPEVGHRLLFILTLDGIDLALTNCGLKIWDYPQRQSIISGRTINHTLGVQNSVLEALKNLKGDFEIDMNRCDGSKNIKLFDALLLSKDGSGLVFGIEYERNAKSGAILKDFFRRIVTSYFEEKVHVVIVVSKSRKVLDRYRTELLKTMSSESLCIEYKDLLEQKDLSGHEIQELTEIFCFHQLELK